MTPRLIPDPARLPRRAVYVLHLTSPLGHSRHYIGFSEVVTVRLEQHRAGKGARMLAVCRERGIGWVLARIYVEGTPRLERKLKARHNGAAHCPLCTPGLPAVSEYQPVCSVPVGEVTRQAVEAMIAEGWR